MIDHSDAAKAKLQLNISGLDGRDLPSRFCSFLSISPWNSKLNTFRNHLSDFRCLSSPAKFMFLKFSVLGRHEGVNL